MAAEAVAVHARAKAGGGGGLTVQADVVEGEDHRAVALGHALHGAVDPPVGGLHIVLLQGGRGAT